MNPDPQPNPAEPMPQPAPARKPVSWRLFWLLALAILLAALLLLPYALQLLQAGHPQQANQVAAMRISVTVASVLQAILLYWPLTLLGLIAAGRLGLGAPYLAAWIEGQPVPVPWKRLLSRAALIGFGGGFGILIVSALLSLIAPKEFSRLNSTVNASSLPNAWQGFLGSISAGISEEILLRLFLLSALAWVIQYAFTGHTQARPRRAVLWAANVLAAIVFGLLHLPNLSALNVPVSPFLLAFIIAMNGAAGLGFGWLFWTYGLESAMLAHFFMDLILHVLTAPLQGLAR